MYHFPYCLAIMNSKEFAELLGLTYQSAILIVMLIVVLLRVDYLIARCNDLLLGLAGRA
jgi:hypothetical protein